jgi:hypothetical protein
VNHFSETILALRAASEELRVAHDLLVDADSPAALALVRDAAELVAKAIGKVVVSSVMKHATTDGAETEASS